MALPELNRLTGEAHALRKAEKPLDRSQEEVMRVGERLTLFARVMEGSAFLIVPASKSETDQWVVPSGITRDTTPTRSSRRSSRNYKPWRTAYMTGDGFRFSRAAHQLRETLRSLSPSVYPTDRALRLEYFYNHFSAFYRAIWFYGLAFLILLVAHFRDRGRRSSRRRLLPALGVTLAIVALAFHASGIVLRCMIAGRPARDEHVRIDHLGLVCCLVFRDDFFRALPDAGLSTGRTSGHVAGDVARAPDADRHAVEHRSAGAGVAR